MNRSATYLLFTILLLFPSAGYAQFLNIQIEVEPETEARVEQSLSFGQVASNSGLVQINPGDPNMGVFSINAVRTQRMLLTMHTPDVLEHPNLNAQIPMDLQLAYVNFGVNDYRQSRVLTSPQEELVIHPPPNQPDSEWSTAYLYVYGSIDIGNVPPGVYSGDVTMSIEYQ